MKRTLGRLLARLLLKPSRHYKPFAVNGSDTLLSVLRPGDVLLVEGNQRVSTVIKYLTQSTWSHAALYIGDAVAGDEPMLVEADLESGVIAVPVSKYGTFNTRICRAVGLSDEDRRAMVDFMVARIGDRYDLEHIIDLLRYFFPLPVPARWRRRMLAFGSGDPTRAICSSLIARAFQSIRYPILPTVERVCVASGEGHSVREVLHIQHHSLFVPRDFDLSPYFRVVKPTVESGFNYRDVVWGADVDPAQ